MGKIKDKSKKIKLSKLEVVPKEVENEPLPESRSSDDLVPKKVRNPKKIKFCENKFLLPDFSRPSGLIVSEC